MEILTSLSDTLSLLTSLPPLCLSLSLSLVCRVPVQYIIGEWDFRNVTLLMRPPVFIPEPETEVGVHDVYVHYNNRACAQLKRPV